MKSSVTDEVVLLLVRLLDERLPAGDLHADDIGILAVWCT